MNTIDKVRALEKTIRTQQHTIKTIVGTIDRLNKKNTSLSKRIDNLEDILVDKLQEIFEGDDIPLSEIEGRLLKLEGIWKE